MPIFLECTDLQGAPKGSPGKPLPVNTQQQPQVTIPLSDSRTGQLSVSMYEAIAGVISAGDTAMKVSYRNPAGTSMLLLNGIVLQPTFDFDKGTVTVTLIDPTVRLKHRYLGYVHDSIMLGLSIPVSDAGVDAFTGGSFDGLTSPWGIPLDGTGLRVIVWDAAHGTQLRGGTPPFGIRKGLDSSTPQPALLAGIPPPGVGGLQNDGVTAGVGFTGTIVSGSNTMLGVDFSGATMPDGSTPTIANIVQYARIDGPGIDEYTSVVSAVGTTITMSRPALATATVTNGFATEDAIYCQLARADCCYDDILDMVQAAGGVEADWIPVDANHTGISGASWNAGEMCELYTADRIGTDRSQGNPAANAPVVFVHGENGFHLTFAPDADQMVTYAVETGPGGPLDPLDFFNKATLIADSADTYGYWEVWEQATSAGQGSNPISNALLFNRATAKLIAYQYPPKFLTATIDADKIGTYLYGTDFFLGDTVTVYGKKGHVTVGPYSVRIVSIGITQTDDNGNCQLDLQLVPHVQAPIGISTAVGGVGGGLGG